MTIGGKYIDLIAAVYGLNESTVGEMTANENKFTEALSAYYWDDIQAAVSLFFTRKSDKERPRLAQILAILETWAREERISKAEPDVEPEPEQKYHLPKTKLFVLREPFDKMIDILVKCRILPPEFPADEPQGAGYSLIDKDGTPVLNPRQWLRWQVAEALEKYPDIYAKYPPLNFWEQLAVGLANKLIVFRVREWAQYAQNIQSRPNAAPMKNLAVSV